MESTKQKYVVIKRVFANEFIVVEAESPQEAVNEVCEGNGFPMRSMQLEWNGDMPPNFWDAELLTATDEEMEALRRSARTSHEELFTGSDSLYGDDEC